MNQQLQALTLAFVERHRADTAESIAHSVFHTAAGLKHLDLVFEPDDTEASRTGRLTCRLNGHTIETVTGVYRSVFRAVLSYIVTAIERGRPSGSAPTDDGCRVRVDAEDTHAEFDVRITNTAGAYALSLDRIAPRAGNDGPAPAVLTF